MIDLPLPMASKPKECYVGLLHKSIHAFSGRRCNSNCYVVCNVSLIIYVSCQVGTILSSRRLPESTATTRIVINPPTAVICNRCKHTTHISREWLFPTMEEELQRLTFVITRCLSGHLNSTRKFPGWLCYSSAYHLITCIHHKV